jgi:hypothetical protein
MLIELCVVGEVPIFDDEIYYARGPLAQRAAVPIGGVRWLYTHLNKLKADI